MKKLFFISLFITFSFCKSQEEKVNTILDVPSFKTEVIGKNVQLIDVRTPDEYNQGHIKNALNIDFFDNTHFSEKFNKLDKNKAIYIYCQSGTRSHKTAMKLEEMGFNKIYDLQGGYMAWTKSGN
ncbi:MAG: rhodanese-like domain-containing protein [Flavobacteriales bacterium]